MLTKKIALILLTFGILGVAGAVSAQDDAKPKEKGFFGRLDDFGKSIFGGILPSDSSKKKNKETVVAPKTTSKAAPRKPSLDATSEIDVPKTADHRSGSILTGSEAQERVALGDPSEPAGEAIATSDAPPTTPDQTVVAKSSRGGANLIQENVDSAIPRIPDEPATTAASRSAARPLSERLAAARESVFASRESSSETNTTKPNDSSDRATEPSQPTSDARALVAQRTAPEADAAEPVIDPMARASQTPDDRAASSRRTAPSAESEPSQPLTTSTPVVSEKATEAKPDADGVLITRKGPVLGVETLGPRRIAVGKESTYEVVMSNSGEVAGEDLIVYISLPEWAEVVGAQASVGTAEAAASEPTARSVQWKLGRLNANGRERLSLRIVPRQSKPFDLAVRWQYKPVASQAMIEVQEPKLVLQLDGPRDVLFGKREVYRLKLANTGNGAADNVVIMLMPIGGGENVPATHRIGGLAAGAEKTLDVELTARQAGHLTIQVDARAEGSVHAELSERVFVRRADLKLEVEGPKMQFVGATTVYAVRLRNPGTAAAKNLNLSVTLPAGMKYLSGVDDAKLDESGKLRWKLASLKPDAEQIFLLKCSLGDAGVSRVTASVAADDELTASADTTTQIDAVANLTMDVKNPEGPVAVGEEATYQVRIRNRGTRAAENVEVFAYFSRGIEPTTADGGSNRIEPGQVVFQPVATLAAGAELVFSIRARAEVAGTHVFRAETHCKPLNSRLICETNNLYYADAAVAQQTSPESHNAGQRLRDAMRPIPHALPGEK